MAPRTRRQSAMSAANKKKMTSLPVEILIMIAQHSRPDGFESLLLSCKTLYHAARNLCDEHNHFKVKFALAECRRHRAEHHLIPGIQTAGVLPLLRDAFDNPLAASYVQTAVIRNWCCRRTEDDVDAELVAAKKDTVFMNHLKSFHSFGLANIESYGAKIDSWTRTPHLPEFEWMLLLVQYPQLRTLMFDNLVEPSFRQFGDVAYAIVKKLDHFREKYPSEPVPFLHLRHIEIHQCFRSIVDPEEGEITKLQNLAGLRALPNLETLRGSWLCGRSVDVSRYSRFKAKKCSLVELEAVGSWINRRHMQKFLTPCTNIKRFFYSHSDQARVRSIWDGAGFVSAVQERLGKSLEVLGLAMRTSELDHQPAYSRGATTTTAVRDLKGFKKLKHLEIDIQLLRGAPLDVEETDGDSHFSDLDMASASDLDDDDPVEDYKSPHNLPSRLVDLLPDSVVTLRLMTSSLFRDSYVLEQLFDGLDKKLVPNLSVIKLESSESTGLDMDRAYRDDADRRFGKPLKELGFDFQVGEQPQEHEHWLRHEFHGRGLLPPC